MEIKRGHICEELLPPEEREKYWCESCCNYVRDRVSPDGCAFCKLTGMQTYGQMFGGECKGFNVPAEYIEDIRIKAEAPCDIKLIIKEDYPFQASLKEDSYIGSTIGLKFTYLGKQYGSVVYLPEPKVTVGHLRAALPDLLKNVIFYLFAGGITDEGKAD